VGCLNASIGFVGADPALLSLARYLWLVPGVSCLCTLLFCGALALLRPMTGESRRRRRSAP
jgi:hypothetical protein